LGSDITSALTWINSSSSPYETFVSSGNSITNAINTSGFGIIYTSDFSLTSGKLYKISFDMNISSGSIDHLRIAQNTNMDSGLQLDKVPTNGTNIFYIQSSATASNFKFGFRGNDAVAFSMSNLLIKEVTNDIVAYYPLDADSSANGVTNDVTTGETLGSNLVDANTSSGWFDNGDGSTITNITDGVSVADDSGFSDIGYFRDSSILSTDLTVGKLYKVQVDAYHNGVATIELRIRDGSANQLINLTTNNTTYTRYIVAQSTTGGSIRTNNHASNSIAYLTNLSVKEVTSNTGVLK
jgi:hypothetical protein